MRQPTENNLSGSLEAKLEALFQEAMENGVVASVESRGRGLGISIVRVNGETVLHQWDSTYVPGTWEQEIERAVAAIEAGEPAPASAIEVALATEPVRKARKKKS
jgi:hypothetical protein